jgi:glutamate---cysteine ligase / carboxylate-amine ligase
MDDYRFGIEEEYFVIDLTSRDVRRAMARKFFRTLKVDLKERVTNEMLQAQIEVSTAPCATIAQARAQLTSLREIIAERAAGHGLGIVAAGTHPLASGREQKQTAEGRYMTTCRCSRDAT